MILGVTGRICTGKTTAAKVLESNGVRVVDCDEISHYLSGYDPVVQTGIRDHFGAKVFFALGALNRRALANVVFADDRERIALEQILHPPIRAVVQDNIELCQKLKLHLVVVAPLLIEAGMTFMLDRLWVISCPVEAQISRLCRRAGIGPEEAQRWIGAQMAFVEQQKLADLVIPNEGDISDFKQNVKQQWEIFLAQS